MDSKNLKPSIGIKLGFTKIHVAYFVDNEVQVLPNYFGNRSTPSILTFSEKCIYYGEEAFQQAPMNLQNSIYQFNRMVGKNFSDPAIQQISSQCPFKIVQGPQEEVLIQLSIEEKQLYPEELIAILLMKIKSQIETYLNIPIDCAVLTVPACFNSLQRQAILNAGKIAELNILRIVNNEIASVIGQAFKTSQGEGEQIVFLCYFDAGQCSMNIISMEEGIYEVRATNGTDLLGGDDLDNCLIEHCCEIIQNNTQVNIKTNPRAMRRLKISCERAKRILSNQNQTMIEIDSLYNGRDFFLKISRKEFENLCQEQFTKIEKLIQKILSEANINQNAIQKIMFAGGSSRIPKVQQIVKEYLSKATVFSLNVPPDEASATGAAIFAAILTGKQSELLNNILILDVTSNSIGIESVGGIMTPVIQKNMTIPLKKSKVLTTLTDNQENMKIILYEGNSEQVNNCKRTACYNITGLQPAQKGVPLIQIIIEIDVNGFVMLKLENKEKNTLKIFNKQNSLGDDIILNLQQKYRGQFSESSLQAKKEETQTFEQFIQWAKNTFNDEEQQQIDNLFQQAMDVSENPQNKSDKQIDIRKQIQSLIIIISKRDL